MEKILEDLERLSVEVGLSASNELAILNASVEEGLRELEVFFSEYNAN